MSAARKKGTRAETAAVKFLRDNGFPGADRQPLRGREDQGDIAVTAGIIAEVKTGQRATAESPAQVRAWLAETDRERLAAGADIGLLILHPRGRHPAAWHVWTTAQQWSVMLGGVSPSGPDESQPVMCWLGTWCDLARDLWGDPE